MEENLIVGDIVVSLSGHDKNRPYIIIDIDKNFYPAIIDGRYRILSKPKFKNPKHLVKIAHDDFILEKTKSKIATDAEIYKLIKAHLNKGE